MGIVGGGALQGGRHALAALEAGVDRRDRMHVAVEGAGGLGRTTREGDVLADRRGRRGLYVADLGEPRRGVRRLRGRTDGDGAGGAAVDGVLLRSALGRGVGEVLDDRRGGCGVGHHDGGGDCERFGGRDRRRHGQRRGRCDGRRGRELVQRGGVDLAGGDRVDPVFGVGFLGRGGRGRQHESDGAAGGADACGCDERGDGRGNSKLGTHG